ncbi:MAG: phosphoribosylformylglycinamidine cyclo-ligase [Actinobacteria bacterium]|nr:phosphoribosylformylglycinamidine cyclo-ligase [Actinomycetota bacterium]
MSDDSEKKPFTYRDAGVDTQAGARSVEAIRDAVRSTYRPEVIGDIGGFGGLFSAASLREMKDPVLVSATDGVGTKIEIAKALGRHDTVGIDLVAMCVNDIAVTGAEPLFFLDYIAIGRLVPEAAEQLVGGVAAGCRAAGCALIGGEMAEHPGVMGESDYDMSGFCVGVVERDRMLQPASVRKGDVILGLASSGPHSNGYSLIRRVLVEGREEALSLPRVDFGGRSLGDVLLEPTRIYAKAIRHVLQAVPDGSVRAMAHITGGGITENLDRALPDDCDALIALRAWRSPRIFDVIAEEASLPAEEMCRTFNMGIGMAVIAERRRAADVAAAFRQIGESVFEIGEVIEGQGKVVYER